MDDADYIIIFQRVMNILYSHLIVSEAQKPA